MDRVIVEYFKQQVDFSKFFLLTSFCLLVLGTLTIQRAEQKANEAAAATEQLRKDLDALHGEVDETAGQIFSFHETRIFASECGCQDCCCSR